MLGVDYCVEVVSTRHERVVNVLFLVYVSVVC